jgi:hypothetical protein
MNKLLIAGAIAATALTACNNARLINPAPTTTAPAFSAQVSVAQSASGKNYPIVSLEPAVITAQALQSEPVIDPSTGRSGIALIWTLPPDSGFRFDEKEGVAFEVPPAISPNLASQLKELNLDRFVRFGDATKFVHSCRTIDASAQVFRCLATKDITRDQRYKYTIKLWDLKTNTSITIDPNMMS